MSVDINTLKGIVQRWAFANRSKKFWKGLKAKLNAATTIIPIGHISAATFGFMVNRVRRIPSASRRMAVYGRSGYGARNVHASARTTKTLQERLRFYVSRFSANALAQPARVFVIRNNKPTAELLIRQIKALIFRHPIIRQAPARLGFAPFQVRGEGGNTISTIADAVPSSHSPLNATEADNKEAPESLAGKIVKSVSKFGRIATNGKFVGSHVANSSIVQNLVRAASVLKSSVRPVFIIAENATTA